MAIWSEMKGRERCLTSPCTRLASVPGNQLLLMNYYLRRTVRSGTVLFALASLCLSWSGTAGAVSVDDFVPRRYTNSTGILLYRLFIPTNYTAAERFPLV